MEDIFSTAPWITVYGKSKLHAEGMMTLAEYTSENVVLVCKNSCLRVRGTQLQVALLSQSRAIISGNLQSLELR